MKTISSNIFFWRRFNRQQFLYFELAIAGILVVLIPLVLPQLLSPKQSQAAWFDDNWAYRHPVTFTHNADITSDRAVTFTLDTAELIAASPALLQSDCDDVRFTDPSGNLLLFDLTGTCDNASTTYEVIFPKVFNGTNLFYVYYGNPSAPNAEIDSTSYTALTPSGGDPSLTNPTSSGSQEKAPSATLYWKFDESTDNTCTGGTNDACNSGNGGSGLDGAGSGHSWQTEDFCVAGKCLYLDGTTNDNVSVADNANLDFGATTNFTVSAWVKRNGASSAINYIVAKHDVTDDTEDGGYKLWMDADGDFCFGIDDDITWGPDISACSTNANFDDDKWHFVSGVRDQTGTDKVYVYVDGLEKSGGGTSDTTVDTLANSNIFYVGVDRDGTSNEWLGFIDEVKVYSYARSAAQVKADFSSRGSVKGASTTTAGSGSLNNQPAALSNGMVGYWKLDETATPSTDSSGNATSGTWNGNTTSTTGKFGNAGSFDGTGDFIDFGDPTHLDLSTSAMTLSAWFKTNDTATNHFITAKAGATATQYFVRHSSVAQFIVVTSAGNPGISGNTTLSTGTWYHLVGVYDGSKMYLYLNGVSDATPVSQTGAITTSNETVRIGTNSAGNLGENGVIDEVRIYNRALSSAEVTQLYDFAPGPVGHWKMDERTGTTANDSSGLANSATLTNTPTWTNGKYGAGIDFAGSDAHVTRADDDDFDFADDADFTFEAWIRHTTASAQQIILSKYNEAGYKIIMASDGDITCALDYDSTWTPTDSATSTAATYDDNNWHHVACVKNGASSLSLYIDGVLITTDSSLTATNTVANTDPLYIGIDADGTSNDWVGQIDETKIYNYARTSKQIVQDMNAGHPYVGTPLNSPVAHWKFDEGDGTTANDSASQNGSENLTLSAASWTNSGKFGKAWNGTGAVRLSRTVDNDLDFTASDNFAISLWYKTDSATNPSAIEYLVDNTTAQTDIGYSIYANTDGTLCFGIDDDTTWGPDISSCTTTDFYDGNWRHLIAVRDYSITDKTYIYIDTIQRDSDTDTTSGTLTGDNSFFIGDVDTDDAVSGEEFAGDIDEVKVYRYALTENEIKIEYNRGQAQVLGALSDNTSAGSVQASSQEYCIPGDSSTCTAPALEWKLDEKSDSTANDTSTNGKTGTVTLGTGGLWVSGKFGGAVSFNATTSKVQTNSTFTFPSQQTVEAWVYPKGGGEGGSGGVFNVGPTNTNARMQINNNLVLRVREDCNTGAIDATTANNTLTANTWQHVAFTYDNTNAATIVNIYLNGRVVPISSYLAQTCANGDLKTITDNWVFGNNEAASSTWDGFIDHARVFDYVRSPAQIMWDYNRGGPVGHWKMDECQGTTLNDSAGNSLSGTWTGTGLGVTSAGTCATASTAWGNGVTGKINYSLDFDGSDDVVTVTNANAIDFDVGLINGMTFAGWVYAGSDGENDVGEIFDKGSGTYCRVDSQDGSNNLDLECQLDLATTDPNVNIADAFAINTWNHVVMAYADDSDDDIDVYVNGILRSTGDGSGAPASTDTNNLLIGGDTAANFDGQIDDFRVYNYGLNATQVKELYNGGAATFKPVTGAP